MKDSRISSQKIEENPSKKSQILLWFSAGRGKSGLEWEHGWKFPFQIRNFHPGFPSEPPGFRDLGISAIPDPKKSDSKEILDPEERLCSPGRAGKFQAAFPAPKKSQETSEVPGAARDGNPNSSFWKIRLGKGKDLGSF